MVTFESKSGVDLEDNSQNENIDRYVKEYYRGELYANLKELNIFKKILLTQPEIKRRVSTMSKRRREMEDFISHSYREYFTSFTKEDLPPEEQKYYANLIESDLLFQNKIAFLKVMNTAKHRRSNVYLRSQMKKNIDPTEQLITIYGDGGGSTKPESIIQVLKERRREIGLILNYFDHFLDAQQEKDFEKLFKNDFFFKRVVQVLQKRIQ